MRPLRSFLLLLIILGILTGLSFFLPERKLAPLPNEFIPAFPALKGSDKQIRNQEIQLMPAPDTLPQQEPDTVINKDTLISSSGSRQSDLLAPFLDSLSNSKGQTRILYYGDSQVEGDRITFFLRQLLREGRGGTGPGLFLPVMPVMYTKSVWLKSTPNWERYTYLSFRSGEISHNKLGPLLAFCRYLPEGETSSSPEKASVRIRPSDFADSAAATFDLLRIIYSNSSGIVKITVSNGENQFVSDTLRNCVGLDEVKYNISGAKDITIGFEGQVSPDIYGISIESASGIIVDNIPQRGSAGLEFTMIESNNLKEAYELLSPDLIILHYGLNIVKNVRNDYSYYKRGLQRQIAALRNVSHSVPVLIVGVTDMAVSEGDSLRSYRNIPAIVEAQKEASLEAGAAFWDSYEAMGGASSIIRWSEKKPPLAQKDYVHFTYPGADTLSVLLAKALFLSEKSDTTISETSVPQKIIPEPVSVTTDPGRGMLGFYIRKLFNYDPSQPLIFTTPAFWLFMLIVLAGYSLIYKKLFIRNFYLLIVSLFFYYKSGGLFLILLLVVTIIDFTCGLLIYKSQKKFYKRLFILLSILSNLGILAYFKYADFIVTTLNDLLGTQLQVHDFLASFSNAHFGTSFDISSIILPVGISFFTFQSLSYTLDVYRNKLVPVRNIVDFGFYVSFFPQLVAGPIVRASEFIPQLYNEFNLSKREFGHALFLILKGLIKKIIISDFIATGFVDRVFDMPSVYSGFENLMAVYGYGLQIYCDFSGYTDIAIGLGLIMGFRLPVNFNSPYKASDISDFWKRWHISLSRWLKDYLYISLGGNRKGKFRTGINLMITMLLGGLWHGASLKFVLWGGLHGIGLVINRIWNYFFGDRIKSCFLGRAAAVFITFNFVSFCWIFFRASDMDTAFLMIKQMAENFSPGSYLTVLVTYSSIFLLILVGYLIHFLPERIKESYRGFFINIPVPAQVAVILIVAVMLYQMRLTEVVPFIYFRF
jgi:D-alanyl-lipoteichoic acid acyltransferase DltB (MBOAT superfamily)